MDDGIVGVEGRYQTEGVRERDLVKRGAVMFPAMCSSVVGLWTEFSLVMRINYDVEPNLQNPTPHISVN